MHTPDPFRGVSIDASTHPDAPSFQDAEAVKDDGNFRTVITTQQPVLGKHHWTDLAEVYALERSLSSSTNTTATTASVMATKKSEPGVHPTAIDHLVMDSSDDGPSTSATGGIAAELKQRRRHRQQQGLPIRRRRDSRAASGHHRQPTTSRFEAPGPTFQGQGHGREPSVSEQQLQHAHPLQPHVQHPPRVQYGYLLPELSACYMFLSLVLRIWFCLSLCDPVMVRPIVLYPVLVLSVIGDRFVLHLVAEAFFKVKTSSHRNRRGSMTERQEQRQRSSMDFGRRGSQSHDKRSVRESMDGTALSLATTTTTTTTTARAIPMMNGQRQGPDGSGKNAAGDEDGQEQGIEGGSLTGREGLVGPLEHTGQNSGGYELQIRQPLDVGDDDDHYGSMGAIWWAFAGGIVLQLLWISCARLFSRGGLCVA